MTKPAVINWPAAARPAGDASEPCHDFERGAQAPSLRAAGLRHRWDLDVSEVINTTRSLREALGSARHSWHGGRLPTKVGRCARLAAIDGPSSDQGRQMSPSPPPRPPLPRSLGCGG